MLECDLIFSLGNIKDGERIPVSGIKIEGLNQYVVVGAISRLRAYGFVESIQDRVVFGADALLSECVKLSQFGKAFEDFCISRVYMGIWIIGTCLKGTQSVPINL